MRTIVVGKECVASQSFSLRDPDAPNETEFEYAAAKALSCAYKQYQCIVFTGGFRYNDRVSRPDLALVAHDRSHWFVIEVELTSHSLENHVLPQVRAFQYGKAEQDCAPILARELGIDTAQAQTLVDFVPRTVAVVLNKRDARWEIALNAHMIQVLSVSVFQTNEGTEALEVDGVLEVLAQSLGFGRFSAVDRSLRFPVGTDFPLGPLQVDDPGGSPSLWTAAMSNDGIWMTKNVGVPDFEDGSYIQLIRTVDRRLALRRPKLHL